jgi:hypothetical protein
MSTGLRAAVIVTSVTSALIPVVAVFGRGEWDTWSVAVLALAGFIFLLTPQMPVVLTARYEPVSQGKLIGLLLCVLTFGLVPALGLGLFVVAGDGGGLGFALLFFIGTTIVWLIQLLVFAFAARIARGRNAYRHAPAYFRWV